MSGVPLTDVVRRAAKFLRTTGRIVDGRDVSTVLTWGERSEYRMFVHPFLLSPQNREARDAHEAMALSRFHDDVRVKGLGLVTVPKVTWEQAPPGRLPGGQVVAVRAITRPLIDPGTVPGGLV